jgi:very-long-chain (3R)-3-hydroxyacyl-CoA dehydratase
VTYYLVAYNILSTIGWAYILVFTLIHIFDLDGRASAASAATHKTASSTIWSLLRSSGLVSRSVETHMPSWLQPIYIRSKSTFARVGTETALVQTFAILEVIHALLGWVRSPLQTTAMQVASRLFLIWGVTEQFESVRPRRCLCLFSCNSVLVIQVHTNPLFTSMVLAWSITEIIRYSFYACNLLGLEPHFLLYLRYTTFYVLYPVGASSEAFLIYSTLPESSPIPGWRAWIQGMWKPADYFRALLFGIWWPCMSRFSRRSFQFTKSCTALYVLYTYMITQRKRALGGNKFKGSKAN